MAYDGQNSTLPRPSVYWLWATTRKGQDFRKGRSLQAEEGLEEAAAEGGQPIVLPHLWGNKSSSEGKSEWPQRTQPTQRENFSHLWQREVTHRPEVDQDEDNATQCWSAYYPTAISSMEGLRGLAPLAPWTGFVDDNFPMNRLGGAGGRAVAGGDGFGMIRVHYIYHVLYFYLSIQKNSSPNITEELKSPRGLPSHNIPHSRSHLPSSSSLMISKSYCCWLTLKQHSGRDGARD